MGISRTWCQSGEFVLGVRENLLSPDIYKDQSMLDESNIYLKLRTLMKLFLSIK